MSNGIAPHQGSMEKILKFSASMQPKIAEWAAGLDADALETLSNLILKFEEDFSKSAGKPFTEKAAIVMNWLETFSAAIDKSGKTSSTWTLLQTEIRELCKTVPTGISEKIAVMGSATLLIGLLLTHFDRRRNISRGRKSA
ncbi:MAG: hypothetical protein JNL01_16450 [Bdellovibrionales bacterium]|nr:hypothetical protein [Bdellovibrionales bacterium]